MMNQNTGDNEKGGILRYHKLNPTFDNIMEWGKFEQKKKRTSGGKLFPIYYEVFGPSTNFLALKMGNFFSVRIPSKYQAALVALLAVGHPLQAA